MKRIHTYIHTYILSAIILFALLPVCVHAQQCIWVQLPNGEEIALKSSYPVPNITDFQSGNFDWEYGEVFEFDGGQGPCKVILFSYGSGWCSAFNCEATGAATVTGGDCPTVTMTLSGTVTYDYRFDVEVSAAVLEGNCVLLNDYTADSFFDVVTMELNEYEYVTVRGNGPQDPEVVNEMQNIKNKWMDDYNLWELTIECNWNGMIFYI